MREFNSTKYRDVLVCPDSEGDIAIFWDTTLCTTESSHCVGIFGAWAWDEVTTAVALYRQGEYNCYTDPVDAIN